jgi:long-subunit acyl-CoA synthetase (AMP-forming)
VNSLLELLANPLIITTEELVSEFADWGNLRLKTIENLRTTPTSRPKSKGTALKGYQKGSDEVAVLMLTSGSTGVRIRDAILVFNLGETRRPLD